MAKLAVNAKKTTAVKPAAEKKSDKAVKKPRRTLKESKSALEEAFNEGYRVGWDAHGKFQGVTGEKTAMQVGVAKGMRDHRKSDKFQSRLNRKK